MRAYKIETVESNGNTQKRNHCNYACTCAAGFCEVHFLHTSAEAHSRVIYQNTNNLFTLLLTDINFSPVNQKTDTHIQQVKL